MKSTVSSTKFGAVTEYELPGPSRWSNAITVAPDDSVWFGEQSVPGVGHLFANNGTLLEYAWPSTGTGVSQGSCELKAEIWGVALWNGMIWGANGDQSTLVGLNPSSGETRVVNVSGVSGGFPYALSVGPDGALWFTLLSTPASVGRLSPDYQLSIYGITTHSNEIPVQVQFVNSTYAYYVALDLSNQNSSGLFSFNPQGVQAGIVPTQVGADFRLLSPSSVSASDGVVWVTQHGAASVASYNTSSGAWTVYPTSTENYTITTLPYFVQADGPLVWFNEHYGNKIGLLDPKAGILTEYSEADPPVYNGSAIGNDLTIASTKGGLWFTSVTGNYIGFVDGAYRADFSLTSLGANGVNASRGDEVSIQLAVNGSWSKPLRVQVSDSENYKSVPEEITLTPAAQTIAPASRTYVLQVEVSVGTGVAPGRYTLAVTVTDGLVYKSVYAFLTVR